LFITVKVFTLVPKLYQSLLASGTENCGFERLMSNAIFLYESHKKTLSKEAAFIRFLFLCVKIHHTQFSCCIFI